jgi:hypothetical protein
VGQWLSRAGWIGDLMSDVPQFLAPIVPALVAAL